MVNIYYDTIDQEILEVARMICRAQKTDVKIITPTEIVEVHHEEEAAEKEADFGCHQEQASP